MPHKDDRNEAIRASALAREFVFTPAQAAAAAVSFHRMLRDTEGLGFGVPSVDRELLLMRPGDVVGIIGRPGHGKSSVLAAVALHNARQIAKVGKQDEECVVYVTLEQTVEEMEALFQAGPGHSATQFIAGEIPTEHIERLSLVRPGLPIWTVGRSIQSPRSGNRITADNLYLALRGMEREFHVKIRLVCLDYIQILPSDRPGDRTTQVGQAIVDSKELAQSIAAPLIFGVQASRGVDGRDDKLATLADCQHASQIEQTADKLFSVGRPWLWREIKMRGLDWLGSRLDVTRDMFLMRKIKERFNDAGNDYLLTLIAELVRLSEREESLSDAISAGHAAASLV